ncbi:MAG: AbrB/MazE/SpoVT family DNA-binding domain-containing protein [Betaproteobacteria bacterium]|nr:AbrB/MazE/SpoVT family DNA-binding domain-containing protein [Betaproteobacteria bacterium]
MALITVSRKGQVVIPAELRVALGIEPGSRVEIGREDEHRLYIAVPGKQSKPFGVDDLLGCTGYRGPVIPVEEMDPIKAFDMADDE